MATNEYVNKVEFGSTTIMDISDTTADAADVIDGEVFYTKSGARSVGTLSDATQSAHGLMSTTDKIKLDGITTMTGATSSDDGAAGLIPAPASADREKFLCGDGTWQDGGRPMVILSYGTSTWAQFEEAYNNNVIVYTRASSNSNPASGSQTRMAFMAYVNNATTPTEVEFQYYRSMSSHSATAMGDQVFVYKLNKSSGWSVTTRDASIKQIKAATNTPLTVAWSSNVVTLTNTMTANDMPMSSSDSTTAKAAIEALSATATQSAAGLMSATDKTKLDTMIDDTAGDGDTDKVYSADKVHDELTSVNQAIGTLQDAMPAQGSGTAGSIVSFTDGAEWPMKLKINIDPIQAGSGDPSPSNVRAISGWTGANVTVTGKNFCPTILSSDTSYSIQATSDTNGRITLTGKYTGSSNSTLQDESGNHNFIIYPGTYVLNGVPANGYATYGMRLQLFNVSASSTILYVSESSTVQESTFTITRPTLIRVRIHITASIAKNVQLPTGGLVFEPMIRLATESDATFAPYQGTTYPITFPTSAGTVYGGTLIVNADGTGKLVVDKAKRLPTILFITIMVFYPTEYRLLFCAANLNQ